ncbi:MAG TPA: DUF1697 domain-containing protein [Kofleriaceae bacterium]
MLRGINVGGANIIPMAALAQCFEKMKFSPVKTFIASGNVIFGAPKQDLRKLEEKIEKTLELAFDYEAKVVVKSKPELDAIINGMPKDWRKPSAAVRYYVMFLRHAINTKAILAEFSPRAGVETLTYVPGALLWAANKNALGKSTVAKKMLSKAIYKEMTVRNLNTTLKLGELTEAANE